MRVTKVYYDSDETHGTGEVTMILTLSLLMMAVLSAVATQWTTNGY